MRLGKRERQHVRALGHASKVRHAVHVNLGQDMPEPSNVRVSSDLTRLRDYFGQTGYAGRSIRVLSNMKGSESRAKHQTKAPLKSETGMVGKQLTKRLHRKVISEFRFKP